MRFEQVLERGDASAVVAAEGHEGAAWSYVLRWQDIHAAHRHAIAAVRAAEAAASTSWRSQALAASGVTGLLLGRSGAATAMRRSLAGAEAVELEASHATPRLRPSRVPGMGRSPRRVRRRVHVARRPSIGHRATRSRGPRLLFGLSYAAWQQGRWAEAHELAAEAARGARLADQQPRFGLLLFSEAVVDAHLVVARSRPRSARASSARMIGRFARGAAALGRDDPATAEAELGPLVAQLEGAGVMEPGALRPAADEIEALIRLDRLDAAADAAPPACPPSASQQAPCRAGQPRVAAKRCFTPARGELDAALKAAERFARGGVDATTALRAWTRPAGRRGRGPACQAKARRA